MFPYSSYPPICKQDLLTRKMAGVDFVFVSGDAYVDHPSFGAALLTRHLEAHGFTVGILAQPDWKNPECFKEFGDPRLGFLVSSGNMDSMVNHYTANKRPRSEDAYSPGGKAGLRPDRAVISYCNSIRAAYPKATIIIGGIESSLRRLTHYDYWSDTVKKPIIQDAKADLLIYGMGERALLEIAKRLDSGEGIKDLRDVRGTVWRTGREAELPAECLRLPDHEAQCADGAEYAAAFKVAYENTDPYNAKVLVEKTLAGFVVQNIPALPLSTEELDAIYEYPYTRTWHPVYEAAGGVPAIQEVAFSLVSARGCFGACAFCAIAFHQGRQIQARSKASLIREATLLTELPGFKGIIHDVGGPTANFRRPACEKQTTLGTCPNRRCLGNEPCPNLRIDHSDYIDVLKALRAVPGVKKVYIRSGIRFDYLMLDRDEGFFKELVQYHVSGQLKVAPEHVSDKVLKLMGKPDRSVYQGFAKRYSELNAKYGLKQYLIPYYISAHPGSTLADAIELAEAIRDGGFVPDQIQDFYPTPGTLSTCMYKTGINPLTGESVYVARGERERKLQHALLHYNRPENRKYVIEALRQEGREDLIGTGKRCLVK
jgi:uncharacterized radical SAM protein YgiQ